MMNCNNITKIGCKRGGVPNALILVLCVSAIIYGITYFYVITNNPSTIHGNSESSHRDVALYILDHGEYPVSHRLPLYPILIAILYWIFGVNNDIPLVIFLGITSVTTIFLVYRIGERLFDQKSGILASILLMSELNLLHSSYSSDLPDAFFTFFITLAIYFTLKCFDSKINLITVFLSAVLLSFAAWIKPVGYYVPFLAFIFISIYTIRKLSYSKAVKLSVAYILVVVLVLGGWQFRNYLKTGYADFTMMKGFHFLFYPGAYILAKQEDMPFSEMKRKLQNQYFHDQSVRDLEPKFTQDENTDHFWFTHNRNKLFFNDALEIIKHNPITFIYVTIRGITWTVLAGCPNFGLNFYSADERIAIHKIHSLGKSFDTIWQAFGKGYYLWIFVTLFSFVFSFFIWSLVLLGIFGSIRKDIRIETLFLILIIAYLALTAGAVMHTRYRLPYESLGAVFAGAFLYNTASRFFNQHTSLIRGLFPYRK